MKKRDKLVLAGLGSLVLCLALAPVVKGLFEDPVQAGPGLRPEHVARGTKQKDLLRELQAAKAPPELERTKRYLEQRFAGLDEPGHSARGVDPDGEEFFLEPEIRVAKTPDGKTYYIQLWSQPVRVNAPLINFRNRSRFQGASVTVPGADPRQSAFLDRYMDQMKPIPLDQAPEGLFQSSPQGGAASRTEGQ